MEREGLITRRRDPANRRIHLVELTSTGDEVFLRLRSAAAAFDRRLRRGISDEEMGQLRDSLTRLMANAGAGPDKGPLWPPLG
jgi:MarR family transcriptional regulator for hemolysin